MSLEEFITKYKGKKNVGNTNQNKGQCVGLVMVYVAEVLELSHIWGHAKDLYANASPTEWSKHSNTPSAYPESGDIIVWNSTKGGGYGHTAIVTKSDSKADTVTVLEQNNPIGSAPKITTYKDWSGIIGWLHPKSTKDQKSDCEEKIKSLETELSEMRESRNKWKSMYSDTQKIHAGEIEHKNGLISGLTKSEAGLRADLEEARKNIDNAQTVLTSKNEEIERLEGVIRSHLDKETKQKEEISALKIRLREVELRERNTLFDFSWTERFLSLFTTGKGGESNENQTKTNPV